MQKRGAIIRTVGVKKNCRSGSSRGFVTGCECPWRRYAFGNNPPFTFPIQPLHVIKITLAIFSRTFFFLAREGAMFKEEYFFYYRPTYWLHQTLNTKIQSLWLKMYRLKIAPVHQGCHAFHTSPDSFCISTASSCLRGFSKFSCSTSTRVCSQCLHCWRRVCIFRSRGFPVTRRRKQWSASRAAAAAAILLYCCCCCCCIWIIHICAGICNSGWLCHGIAWGSTGKRLYERHISTDQVRHQWRGCTKKVFQHAMQCNL